VNERPMAIQMADSTAASLNEISWGVRWTTITSTSNRTVRTARSATQAHRGTSNETNSWPPVPPESPESRVVTGARAPISAGGVTGGGGSRQQRGGGGVDDPDQPVGTETGGREVVTARHGGEGLRLLLAHDRDHGCAGPGDAGEGQGHTPVGVVAQRVVVHHHEPTRIRVEGGRGGEQRGGVPVTAETEVDEVEAAQLTDAELVGVGSLLAAHREVGVHGAHPLEERLAPQAVVGVGVVERDAALVAPVDVDLPPVDLGAALVGEAFVAAAGGGAAGQRHGEVVVRARVERLDAPLG